MRKDDVFGFIDEDTLIPSGFCAIPDEKRAEVMAEIESAMEAGRMVKSNDDRKRTASLSA